MKITILCSSETHPINDHLHRWIAEHKSAHNIELIRNKSAASGGDILFLISCSEIITALDRSFYKKCLVIHASDLPKGRGWSPHIWQIIEGKSDITVTLLEAEDKVDSGPIWKKVICHIPEDALWDEINKTIFDVELALMNFALENFSTAIPSQQSSSEEATYYSRRTQTDSAIDARKSIAEQFDLIRVCDPVRFPATITLRGHTYKIFLEKISNEQKN